MTKEEEWELLIRLDERVANIHTWTDKHEKKHTDEASARRKWLVAGVALISGVIAKVLFWK